MTERNLDEVRSTVLGFKANSRVLDLPESADRLQGYTENKWSRVFCDRMLQRFHDLDLTKEDC